MGEHDGLAELFETYRPHLRAVAHRMLGTGGEADDAVQETWLRLSRSDVGGVANLGGWLTTVVSRVSLDMLRARARREEAAPRPYDRGRDGQAVDGSEWDSRALDGGGDPEQEAVLADSVGRALLVVLDTLPPAERVAFVLHDVFAVPFDQIGPIVGRSPVAAKKLASRARHRLRGRPEAAGAEAARHRRVVDAFLIASREGDMDALMAVLAPEVVRRADPAALPPGVPAVVRGARAVAQETVVLGRRARFAEPALVNGAVGVVVAPHGRLLLALALAVEGERIAEIDVVADPARLHALDLALLDPALLDPAFPDPAFLDPASLGPAFPGPAM
ncbi:RNA polymerase sigma-70 factor, ECF subfamily [Microbispora rosea]|uniref:RNA polymerase sigma-70 factor, ECF subfamily n=1 Tax=Microbispora rosea TaxID=58117 RepID=A0A1N7H560_9ACTN|nr:sigma-70 family RNA polymerase sigma factor [Microbispora rosea]GIH51738.1 DNA-directed RNA polymerase sigma-70 factor [Microbispora rosea subsp. rosea]SIS19994.1 RNA polymerase sigma-70 factor, ECF subfamily [Microbispora rosea]